MASNDPQSSPAPLKDPLESLSPEFRDSLRALQDKFAGAVLGVALSYKIPVIHIAKDKLEAIFDYLYRSPLQFQFLTDLCGVHHPDQKQLEVVYHLHSLTKNLRLRVKCATNVADPFFPSLTPLFSSANWMERETYDFFGIQFVGHPDLKRILNEDSMSYFPMRKEYPLEDNTRTDKNDSMFGR